MQGGPRQVVSQGKSRVGLNTAKDKSFISPVATKRTINVIIISKPNRMLIWRYGDIII